MKILRRGEVIDEDFAVETGDIRSGDGNRRSEGFQQSLEDMFGLPALRDGLVEITEDAERNFGIEVTSENRAEELEVGDRVKVRTPDQERGGQRTEVVT